MAYHRWDRVSTDLLIYYDRDDAWIYVTALRGPDDDLHGDGFKRLVTAVIRGDCSGKFMSISDGAYGMNNFTGHNFRYFSKEDVLDVVKNAPHHCVVHSCQGLDTLSKWYIKQEYVDDEAVQLLKVMHRSLYDMHYCNADALQYAEDYRIALYKFFEAWTGDKE